MKDLIIIGARGMGRDSCMQFSIQSNYQVQYKVKGFLDDQSSALDDFEGYPPIIGSVEDYKVCQNDVFFCALGDPIYRKKYVEMILSKGGEFVSCISEKALISPNARVGKGVMIGPFTVIDTDVIVDDFASILNYCSIGHNSIVGKFCEIEPYSAIGGGAIIGNESTLHPRSTILPKVHVGNNVSVGVGSIVMKNIEDGLSVYGNPARPIKI